MILNNQYYKIILWLTTYLVGATAQTCPEVCPSITRNAPVADLPTPPPMGNGCQSELAFDCGVGSLVQIICSNPNNFTVRCIVDPNYVMDPPQPPPCPTVGNPPSTSTGTTDTVLIVVIVVLAVVLLLSWAGFLLLWLRKRKPSAPPKKKAQNHYTPTPKKAAKEEKKKEKMSMSGRPPLPKPRPTSGEAAQTQAEYDYIDPSNIRDEDSNAYLEMVE